jgi:hypothetical protein
LLDFLPQLLVLGAQLLDQVPSTAG